MLGSDTNVQSSQHIDQKNVRDESIIADLINGGNLKSFLFI
jgi:hypothetical protein